MMDIPFFHSSYPQRVLAIETGYHRALHDALYLIEEPEGLAFVDCGTQFSWPRALATLTAIGREVSQVRYLFLTHIHLDHAGGAGTFMQHCPNAQLVVHPRGVRHMADPSQLLQATQAVYGVEKTQALYGNLVAVPQARIHAVQHGERFLLGQRELICYDAPGHAKHHIVIWDPTSQGVFTGDAFGLAYQEFNQGPKPFVFPTTTPTQFDPSALIQTHQMIAALAPQWFYPTHFGANRYHPDLIDEQAQLITQLSQTALAAEDLTQIEAGVEKILRAHCSHSPHLEPQAVLTRFQADIRLNAQGLWDWAQRTKNSASLAPH